MNADLAKSAWALWLVPGVMLVLAPPIDWPYGYYTLLRLVVCVATGFLAFLEIQYGRGLGPWAIALVLLAFLFNPIFAVHLDRETWAPIDFGAAAFLGVHYWVVSRRKA